MKAKLLLSQRIALSTTSFVEMVIWQVPAPVKSSLHDFKYSLSLVSHDICVLRYDNEAGKGDHKHEANAEAPYRFTDLEALQADFWKDVDKWRRRK